MNGALIWTCPVCRLELERQGHSFLCHNRHTYDISAHGYVNLLLANQRKSKDPGDSKMMLSARRHILGAGYFRKLSDALSQRVAGLAAGLAGKRPEPFTVLEAGCGEGHYLTCIEAEFHHRGIHTELYGTDISKDAMNMAAGPASGIHYAVASSRQLPVRAESVDCLLQIFAPHSDSEFHRVLRHEGQLMTVIPGKHHLYGVKELLYPQPYYNDESEHPYPSFVTLEQIRIQDELVLTDPAAIRNLVMMTPYYWRTDPARINKLADRSEVRTPLEFIITVRASR